MYAYIKGKLDYASGSTAVVEAGGVGYRINTSLTTLSKLPEPGNEVKLYTYLNVREDAMELYGFYTPEELSMYEMVISVSGVGPKVGLAILSTVDPAKFALAVMTSDVKAITKVPGVGPKLAQRIILELKDKLKKEKADFAGEQEPVPMEGSVTADAVEALTVLGYTPAEASQAVAGLSGTLEEMISAALKNLMGRR